MQLSQSSDLAKKKKKGNGVNTIRRLSLRSQRSESASVASVYSSRIDRSDSDRVRTRKRAMGKKGNVRSRVGEGNDGIFCANEDDEGEDVVTVGPIDRTRERGNEGVERERGKHDFRKPERVEIERGMFESAIECVGILCDRRDVSKLTKILKGYTMDARGIQDVVADSDGDDLKRMVLLRKEAIGYESLPSEVVRELKELVGGGKLLPIKEYKIKLNYEYHSAEYCLRKILPDGMETPSAFEAVGHVAHVNLREEFFPYKYLIAKIIADKNPRIRTVVNKVGAIDSQFRVPNWELLYGDADLNAVVKQHGYSFEVDFAKVYWNSRLETEHKRLVDEEFKRGDVIVDAMAGVGPFVVPAVKVKECRVYASDLNPDCFEMMKKNAKLNKIEDSVKLYNMDARAFVKSLLLAPAMTKGAAMSTPEETWKHKLSEYEANLTKYRTKESEAITNNEEEEEKDVKKLEKKRKRLEEVSVPKPNWSSMSFGAPNESTPPSGALFDHIVMNLPATALEFLDCLKFSFDRKTWENRTLPMVHAYAFRPPGHTDADVISRAEGHLGCAIKNAKVIEVRDVAPNKAMVCLSFQITPEQAFSPVQ